MMVPGEKREFFKQAALAALSGYIAAHAGGRAPTEEAAAEKAIQYASALTDAIVGPLGSWKIDREIF